jgi:uncharacterized protein YdeI (YjbR/CyaY-like superfamily)
MLTFAVALLVKPTFFRSPSELRKWFERNHATAPELWVGFYKKSSGKASIRWIEENVQRSTSNAERPMNLQI